MKPIELKSELLKCCKAIIQSRIDRAKTAMDAAQQAANSEEKSSAGDKYETSRAMGQLDRDMNARQFAEALDTLKLLTGLNVSNLHRVVKTGSVVCTSSGRYFISVSAGSIQLDGKEYLAVSPMAPIAQTLLGRSSGDVVIMNRQEIIIQEVL